MRRRRAPLQALRDWARGAGPWTPLAARCDRRFAAVTPSAAGAHAARPHRRIEPSTGCCRATAVLCLADDDADRLAQLAAVLAVGSRAVWPAEARRAGRAPAERAARAASRWRRTGPARRVHFDAVLHHGDAAARLRAVAGAGRTAGPIVGVIALDAGRRRVPLERLVIERSLSINTAAAGGNASLMTIG